MKESVQFAASLGLNTVLISTINTVLLDYTIVHLQMIALNDSDVQKHNSMCRNFFLD